MKKYKVSVFGNYAEDVIMIKADSKSHALSKFKEFVYEGSRKNNLHRYNSILDRIKKYGVGFVEEYEECDFDELKEDFMLLAQFIE